VGNERSLSRLPQKADKNVRPAPHAAASYFTVNYGEEEINFAGRFRHEHARVRLVAHSENPGESEMILMRMVISNGSVVGPRFGLQFGNAFLTRIFGGHPALENQPLLSASR